MANYKQTTIQGDSWVRSNRVIIENQLDQTPSICFNTERVINLGSTKVTQSAGLINQMFTPDVFNKTFELVNPETGESIGQTMEYINVYVIIHSLFLHLAVEEENKINTPPVIITPEDQA